MGSRAADAAWEMAQMLEFEYAAILRDRLIKLRGEK
jgi:excinuclease UvrABC helicase subunit UvrB